MSMSGELNIFLGIQVKQTKEWIFILHSKYAKELAKKFWIEGKSHAHTSMITLVKISTDLICKNIDLTLCISMIESLFTL